MATESEPSALDPQLIGNVFIEKFYTILHRDPTQAYKFYIETSMLSRPGPDGSMKSVNTLKDINELILSLDYQSYKAEISFADAQISFGDGVIVLVTGSLIGMNDVRRKFSQTFFLAPQKNGYYVLNDVFRYLDDKNSESMENNDLNESTQDALSPESGPTQAPEIEDLSQTPKGTELTQAPQNEVINHVTDPSVNDGTDGKETCLPLGNGDASVSENEVLCKQLEPSEKVDDSHPAALSQTASLIIQDDTPKKSYLSVVHAMTKNSAPFIARVSPSKPSKPKPVDPPSKAAAPEPSAAKTDKTPERSDNSPGKNSSIFVANLPMDTTEEMLRETFIKFGPIKPNGIQVRSFKENKNCFGFVEFESASSMQSAVMASPIIVGNRKANIEEKKGPKSGRGAYRDANGYGNDNFRGRGNFNGGRNFRKSERGEVSNQSRSNFVRNGDSNRKFIKMEDEETLTRRIKI